MPLAVTVCASVPWVTGTVVKVTAAARERTTISDATIAATTSAASAANHHRERRRGGVRMTDETWPLVDGRSRTCMAVLATSGCPKKS